MTLHCGHSQDRPTMSSFLRGASVRSFLKFHRAWLLLACVASLCHAESAYVPNEGSGTVTVIDTATDKPSALIPRQGTMGAKLRGVALDVSGKTLFVVDAIGNVEHLHAP